MTSTQRCPCHSRHKESILTLDGGGIRGYASLLILMHLMTNCLRIEHFYDAEISDYPHQDLKVDNDLPLPCHYFDYMFGTSTGGIIAIMLGRLRMTIGDCISAYKDFGRKVFGRKRRSWKLRYNKYDAKKVEAFMAKMVKRHCHDREKRDSPLLRDPTVLGNEENDRTLRQRQRYVPCRVAVLSVRKAASDELYMFRSYHNSTTPNIGRDLGKLLNLTHQREPTIVEAARATSAAPTYFSPVRIDGSDFMDGGLEANNPSNWAWREVDSMHQNNPGGECVGTHGGVHHLVSVGTGKGAHLNINIRGDRIRRGISIVKKCLNQMTNPEPVHQDMEHMAKAFDDDVYFRFNVEKGLEKMRLDQFEVVGGFNVTLEKIEHCVNDYLAEPETKRSLESVARRLVDHRRDRCKPGMWRKYRGLSRPGPLDEIYHERFQHWDDEASTPQHPTPPSGCSPPRHGASELMSKAGPCSHVIEMSASPVQSTATSAHQSHAHEVSSSPVRSRDGYYNPQSSSLRVQTDHISLSPRTHLQNGYMHQQPGSRHEALSHSDSSDTAHSDQSFMSGAI